MGFGGGVGLAFEPASGFVPVSDFGWSWGFWADEGAPLADAAEETVGFAGAAEDAPDSVEDAGVAVEGEPDAAFPGEGASAPGPAAGASGAGGFTSVALRSSVAWGRLAADASLRPASFAGSGLSIMGAGSPETCGQPEGKAEP